MNKNCFKSKILLLTGGTGSFGRALINYLLKKQIFFYKLNFLFFNK